VEWYYCLGKSERGSLVRIEGGRIHPTVEYERSREGIDDLKYACTLESTVARARAAGKAAPQVQAAEALLKRIADSIIDDWTAYAQGGERFPADGLDAMDPARAADIGRFNSVRRALAEAIIAVEKAM